MEPAACKQIVALFKALYDYAVFDLGHGALGPGSHQVLRAAQSLDLRGNPFLLPGIRVKTSKTLYFPIRQVFLYRYDNKQWVKASKLLAARA